MHRTAPRLAFSFLAVVLGCFRTPLAGGEVQVAEGQQAMVVSGHVQASAAGLEILKSGGNVIDAAVAVSLCLGVAEPYGSGLGGKLVMVYRDAATGRVQVIEALDQAPLALDAKAFAVAPRESRRLGALSVGVPGLPAGLLLAHEKWGKLPRATVFEPAIRLARAGFEVQPAQVRFFQSQEKKIRANDGLAALYLPAGRLPRAGEILPNPELAHTFQLMAERGRDGFYRGEVAASIVSALQAGGSVMTEADFAGYEARLVDPVSVKFEGVDIYSAPPPSTGGGIALLTLALLDGEDKPAGGLFAPEAMDHLMRVYLEANYAARKVLGDYDSSLPEWRKLLAPAEIARLRSQVMRKPVAETVLLFEDEGAMAAETTHFVVMDSAGNVVSVTQSQSLHFGSGLVPAGTGVVLNDSLSNFSTSEDHPNTIRAGGRPSSTITPTVLVKNGRTLAGIGLPGGSRIPSAIVQVLYDRLLVGTSFDAAIGAPRFFPNRRATRDKAPSFQTEGDAGADLAKALAAHYGWEWDSDRGAETFGGVNAIELDDEGVLHGFADLRRSNVADGY